MNRKKIGESQKELGESAIIIGKKRLKAKISENNRKKVIKNQKRLWYNGVIEEVLYIISGVKHNEKSSIKYNS